MFGVTKDELIRGLENLRLRLCCYSPQPTCDCKYGVEWVEKPTEEEMKENPEWAQRRMRRYLSQQQSLIGMGEQTGCPELRQVIGILRNMSSKEFRYYNGSAGIEVTDVVFKEKLNDALNGEYEIVSKEGDRWTNVRDFKFVGSDIHMKTADGRLFILENAKVVKREVKYDSDSLVVEKPEMTYGKVLPGEVFYLSEPKYIGDLKEHLKQEKMCEANRNGDLFPPEETDT